MSSAPAVVGEGETAAAAPPPRLRAPAPVRETDCYCRRSSCRWRGAAAPAASQVLRLLRIFWWDSTRRTRLEAAARLASTVAVMLLRARRRAWLSTERRRQVDTMLKDGGSDRAAILRGLLRYVGALAVLVPIDKLYWRLLRGLRHQWRRHLTGHFLAHFVEAHCLSYGTTAAPPEAAACGDEDASKGERNPDQRISDDVGIFVQLVTSLGLESLEALIHLWTFSALLRELSPILSRSVLLCAAVGTWSTGFLGGPLRALYAAERDADGDFTYAMTRLRENAESVAFYHGQPQEVGRLSRKLERRLATEWRRLARKDVVQAFSMSFRQVVGLLPVYVLGGRMKARDGDGEPHGHSHPDHGQEHGHAGHGAHHGHAHSATPAGHVTDIGVVNQAREIFDEVLYHLLIFAENLNDFSRLVAVARELSHYDAANMAALERARSREAHSSVALLPLDSSNGAPGAKSWLQIEGLSLWTPSTPARCLVRDLNLSAPPRGGLLITGPSGAGKTTLLRSVAGLWLGGTGTITREMDPRNILFLPQKPYMQVGSLREQLLYPFAVSGVADSTLCKALQRVGLRHVLDNVAGDLGATMRWSDELSVGEQQRISIARLLVHRPAFAILDETTSANDAAHECTMYQCVLDTCTAFVSVGHRKSLEAFHVQQLRLLGEQEQGCWQLHELPPSDVEFVG